jgi:hypothetical protein
VRTNFDAAAEEAAAWTVFLTPGYHCLGGI